MEVKYQENDVVPFEEGLAELEREIEQIGIIQGREVYMGRGKRRAKITYKLKVML